MSKKIEEYVKKLISEAARIKFAGHTFVLKVDTNEDPQKKGVKVQILPTQFGSITTTDFIKELSNLGHELDRKFVRFNTIKEIGSYEAEIRLHRNVKISIPFEVISEK